jgi:hypothetical protein
VLALLAAGQPLGFAVPMLISTSGAVVIFVVTLLFGPETKGKILVSEITLTSEPRLARAAGAAPQT